MHNLAMEKSSQKILATFILVQKTAQSKQYGQNWPIPVTLLLGNGDSQLFFSAGSATPLFPMPVTVC
jgi:hypothetical protein